jgi:hypothetical protein
VDQQGDAQQVFLEELEALIERHHGVARALPASLEIARSLLTKAHLELWRESGSRGKWSYAVPFHELAGEVAREMHALLRAKNAETRTARRTKRSNK